MNTNQPISAARAAALLSAMVPEMARVGLYPQWSDGTGAVVRRTRALPFDADGRIIELPFGQQRDVSAVLRRIGDVDLERPQVLDVATGEVSPVFGPPVPLWLSPAADGDDCPCERGEVSGKCSPRGCSPTAGVPDAGALLEQRHQLEDPAEPPLGGAQPDPGRDCARSLAAGLMKPVAWGDDAPGCEPEFVERDTVDVPVQGGAL